MVLPQIVHPNIQISDITREFRNAASRLQPGKLVRDEHFTLFEAVSALEIGDPKMDSGSLGFDPVPEESLDLSIIPSTEEIIWLMDELMCREAAWHMGYPLSQTLFTSVHIERLLWPEPKQLIEARFDRAGRAESRSPSAVLDVFQCYCIGLIKCCDLVLSMITSEHYYEEEDFATQTFNRPLLHKFPVSEVLTALQNSRTSLRDGTLPPALSEALNARLDLRHSLLELFESCTIGELTTGMYLENIIANMRLVESTASLGRRPAVEAFTLKIQRDLASSVPPRPMVLVERPRAFAFVRQLITDTIMAFKLFDITSSGDLLVAYQIFMAQSPQPAVYVRALLQSFLTHSDAVLGKFTVKEFISQDIQSLVRPSMSLLDINAARLDDQASEERSQLSSQIDSFINRCGHSFLNLFRAFCLNRCRLRRTLCHAAIEWDQMQADAEEVDVLAQSVYQEEPVAYPPGEGMTFSYSLSSWVYHHKLMQLRTIVQTGFELAIYAPHEFADMYWYLSFLSNTHLLHLERISYFVSFTQSSAASPEKATRETLDNLYRHFTWLKATEALAKVLHRLFVVIQRHGHLTRPSRAYASALLRYELRMRPFMHLSVPEPISVHTATEMSSLRSLSDVVILQQASQLQQVARKAWDEVLKAKWTSQSYSSTDEATSSGVTGVGSEHVSTIERQWREDVQNSLRTCIGAGIAISTLTNAVRENRVTTVKVKIPAVGDRDRWHSAWPVPKLSW